MTDWADEKIQEILANPDRIPLNVVPNGLLGRVAHALREADAAAERRGMERAAEWQPIETAPKDETEILLSDGQEVTMGFWIIGDEDEGAPAGWWTMTEWWPPDHYTHWMPLPKQPIRQSMEARDAD